MLSKGKRKNIASSKLSYLMKVWIIFTVLRDMMYELVEQLHFDVKVETDTGNIRL